MDWNASAVVAGWESQRSSKGKNNSHRRDAVLDPELRSKGERKGYLFFLFVERTKRNKPKPFGQEVFTFRNAMDFSLHQMGSLLTELLRSVLPRFSPCLTGGEQGEGDQIRF